MKMIPCCTSSDCWLLGWYRFEVILDLNCFFSFDILLCDPWMNLGTAYFNQRNFYWYLLYIPATYCECWSSRQFFIDAIDLPLSQFSCRSLSAKQQELQNIAFEKKKNNCLLVDWKQIKFCIHKITTNIFSLNLSLII